MGTELHIRIHEDAIEPPEEILRDFPFDEGQAIVSYQAGIVVIDLGDAEDTNYVQEWYLNSHDSVLAFYIVED